MAYDSLIMQAVTAELNEKLSGARVQRIYEPKRSVVLIHLYCTGKQPALLFSIDPGYARVHLTNKRYPVKQEPSPFCMLLRKYLVGSRVATFCNPPLERILEIAFEPTEGMPPVRLIAEVMGRRSNLILVNEEKRILGAARTATGEQNPMRTILPGELYRLPPVRQILNPMKMEIDALRSALKSIHTGGKSLEQALILAVGGISPPMAREMLFRSCMSTGIDDKLLPALYTEIKKTYGAFNVKKLQPVRFADKSLFAVVPLTHLAGSKAVKYESVNEMLDQHYSDLIDTSLYKGKREKLKTLIQRRINSLNKKMSEQKSELEAAKKADQYRLYGEILLTYAHQVQKGTSETVLPDLYNPEKTIFVPLDPQLTAAANAQKHFKRYRKAKKGQEQIIRQLKKTNLEIDYCRGLQYALENSDSSSLEEIEQEIEDVGYLRKHKKAAAKKKADSNPLLFKTSSGKPIIVGKNNRQNDYITFKNAVRRDTWFHARKIPGSHVLLKEVPYPPPPEDIEEAAFLAAYFSKGRESNAVDVDYTAIKHVRRHPGGKPGLVLYDHHETITVNPQNEVYRNLFGLEVKPG